MTFEIKDSGKRKTFEGGMVRDTEDGKIDYTNVLHGPMFERWAAHLTRAKEKYPDPEPGVPNWTLARGMFEYVRFKVSAFRHFIQWFRGMVDEDHAAAVIFNINGAEYVKERMHGKRNYGATDRSSKAAQESVEAQGSESAAKWYFPAGTYAGVAKR